MNYLNEDVKQVIKTLSKELKLSENEIINYILSDYIYEHYNNGKQIVC